ncbi:MAG: S8 family serine peptidase, partial [Bdellovibrionaceae bacterium]|nr:S8 family serine peptidase [Pseudobdellovibrionaceae bacterium]
SYGTPRIFYNQAIKNLTLGGTVVVASAGNSGDISYIVGAPSVSDEALSVAASVDGMDHNWKFKSIAIQLADKTQIDAEAVESVLTKPLSEFEEMQGAVVYVGKLTEDPSEEQKNLIKDKIALVDRGVSTFEEKIKRASAAGAVAVIVANNTEDDPFTMGGGKSKFEIPAVMVSKASGIKMKEALKSGEVRVNFKSTKKVEKPELIDTVTDFSSRGPRSEDSLIKPEITGPGQNIISAGMGKGREAVQMSGTSMSGPHLAGVMALMKQFYPELSVPELKSVVMGTSKSIQDKNKKAYPISRVGAGRVQIDRALNASIVADVPALSLGSVKVDQKKVFYKAIQLKNVKPDKIQLKFVFEGHSALSMEPGVIELGPKQVLNFDVRLSLNASEVKESIEEVDGYVKFYNEKEEVFRIPVLAVVRKISGVMPESLLVNSTSKIDSEGSFVQLKLVNQSQQPGVSFPMNLIAQDERKKSLQWDEYRSRACDLQSVGYKIVGEKIYVGFKLYQQVTTWDLCELNMQIDSDGDGQADQEIVGVSGTDLPGLPPTGLFFTLNLDANKAKKIRKDFDALDDVEKQKKGLNYIPALMDVQELATFSHSSYAMMVIDRNKIKLTPTGEVNVKFSTSSKELYAVEGDDFLGNDETEWRRWDITEQGQSFIFSKVEEKVQGKENRTISLIKGQGASEMIIYTPTNKAILNSFTKDDQSEVISEKYLP